MFVISLFGCPAPRSPSPHLHATALGEPLFANGLKNYTQPFTWPHGIILCPLYKLVKNKLNAFLWFSLISKTAFTMNHFPDRIPQ